MSYSFSISYNNVTKKVTCPASSTINNLVSLASEKFKLDKATNACLTFKGKKLDGMLSIRLANLSNNAKLDMVKVDLAQIVNLRINSSFYGKQNSQIMRVSPSITVAALMDQFLDKCGEKMNWANSNVDLSVMQNGISNQSSDFASISVGSLIGTAASASLRLTIEDKEATRIKQNLHKEQEIVRREAEYQKLESAMHSKKLKQEQIEKPKEEETQSSETPEVSRKKNLTNDAVENKEKLTKQIISHLYATSSEDRPPVYEKHQKQGRAPNEEIDEWQPPKESEDTLYNPSHHVEIYENPDDDYNVTTNHAEKYLRMLQARQKPQKKSEPVAPKRYTIRVRFPDQKLLDILLEDSSVALGQLFKRLDTYVRPEFINSYVLKSGSPPFTRIEMGFSQNNVPLLSHPQFQQERLLLVWEPAAKMVSGPYLNESLEAKDIEEMPSVAIETHRKNLIEELAHTPEAPSTKFAHRSEKRAGVPKWFRP